MCNIVQFRFACQHTWRRYRSRCRGTKHKITRTSIKAACSAESSLVVNSIVRCGPCEHAEWERIWSERLYRARTFLTKLKEKRLLGQEDVTRLVDELENEYTLAAWDTRNMFVQAAPRPVQRIQPAEFRKSSSPLTQNLQAHDIVDMIKSKSWEELDQSDYDWDYVASTDPIHPVNTDYAHDSDHDDEGWKLSHSNFEEHEIPISHELLNLTDTGWTWGTGSANTGTDTATASMAAHVTMSGMISVTAAENDMIHQVIKAFWRVVNAKTPETARSETTLTGRDDKSMDASLEPACPLDQALPTREHTIFPPSPPPTPPRSRVSQLRLLLDELSQTSWMPSCPMAESCTAHPQKATFSNPTRTRFDKQRTCLRERFKADHDAAKFYDDWLSLARYELRELEGPEGTQVIDPPRLGQ
ncbi:hypothetical protein ACN47E_007550 [Coniothyrium glycines]